MRATVKNGRSSVRAARNASKRSVICRSLSRARGPGRSSAIASCTSTKTVRRKFEDRQRERGEHLESVPEVPESGEEDGAAPLGREARLGGGVEPIEHAEGTELGRVAAAQVVEEHLRPLTEVPEARRVLWREGVGAPAVEHDPDDVRAPSGACEPERGARVVRQPGAA